MINRAKSLLLLFLFSFSVLSLQAQSVGTEVLNLLDSLERQITSYQVKLNLLSSSIIISQKEIKSLKLQLVSYQNQLNQVQNSLTQSETDYQAIEKLLSQSKKTLENQSILLDRLERKSKMQIIGLSVGIPAGFVVGIVAGIFIDRKIK